MLSKENRLRGFRIPVLLKQGRRVHGEIASIIFMSNETSDSHISVIVPVKLSKKASHRTRTRRLIYEVVRHNNSNIKKGMDIIIMAKKLFGAEKLADIENPIRELLQKANVLS